MANAKPLNLSNKIWAKTGTKETPSDIKIDAGWTVEAPKFQVENWVQNRQDSFIAHINERGIPEWDQTTDYIAAKSYVQGSDGILYFAMQSSGPSTTPQNPVSTSGYWEPAIQAAATVATQPTEDRSTFTANTQFVHNVVDDFGTTVVSPLENRVESSETNISENQAVIKLVSEITGGNVQRFSGDGSTLDFQLVLDPSKEVVSQVFIGGIYLQKNSYSVGGINGDLLTFNEPPQIGTDNIEVVVSSLTPVDEKLRQDLVNNTDPLKGAELIGYANSTVAKELESIKEQTGLKSLIAMPSLRSIHVNNGHRFTIGAMFVHPATKEVTVLGKAGGDHTDNFAYRTSVVQYSSNDMFSSGLVNPLVIDDSIGDPLSPISGQVMGEGRWGVICLRTLTATQQYGRPAFLYSDDYGNTWTKVVLPGVEGDIRFPHGKIINYPASVGGHDTNGWLVLCYDGVGGLWESHTLDNGLTWSSFAQILSSPVGSAASETVITRVGNEDKWILISRNEVSSPKFALVSTSVDMLNWTLPVLSTLELGKNPPAIVERNGSVFLVTSSRDRYIGQGLNTILSRKLDPSTIYNSSGQDGWGVWQVLSELPNFAYGYPQDVEVDGKLYIAIGGGDTFTAGISAYVISDVPGDSSLPIMRSERKKNLLVNGSLKILQGASSNTSTGSRQTTLDNWGISRIGFTLGYSWTVLNSFGGRRALRVVRDQGDVELGTINAINVLSGAEVVALRGKVVSVMIEARVSPDSTLTSLGCTVQSSAGVAKITSSDGSIVGAVIHQIGAVQIAKTPTKVMNSFVVPTDANTLVLRVNAAFAGVGVEFDYFEIYSAALVEGPYVNSVDDKSYDEELSACQKLLYRSYNTGVPVAAATTVGAVGGVADGSTGNIFIPVRTPTMRTAPTVHLFATDGTPGQAYFVSGNKINVAANATGMNGFNIVNTAFPVSGDNGTNARLHYVADAQWW